MVQQAAAIFGLIVVAIGVIGGLLSLPKIYRDFRRERAQHGQKGVGFCVLERVNSPEKIIVRFLIVEDLFQFINGFSKPEFGGVVEEVSAVGQYFSVTMRFPPDANLTFAIVPS